MTDFENMTRRFLMGENKRKEPGMMSRLQALEEALEMIQPRSQSDVRRVEMARENLRGIKRQYRRLEQENKQLQEKLSVLEEEKANAKIEEDYS